MRAPLTGAAAKAYVGQMIAQARSGLAAALAPYAPHQATRCWLQELRAIEELINAPMEFPEIDDGQVFMDLPLWPVETGRRTCAGPARAMLETAFGVPAAARICRVLLQIVELNPNCHARGLPSPLPDVASAAGYLQFRRRLLVALLYVMPRLCRGQRSVSDTTVLLEFLPMLELSAAPLMTLLQFRVLADIYDDFALRPVGLGLEPSHELKFLDPGAMDPERVGLLDEGLSAQGLGVSFDGAGDGEIFSVPELVSGLALTEAKFAEFGLAQTSFGALRALITAWLGQVTDGYYLHLTARDLRTAVEMTAPAGDADKWWRWLVFEGDDYLAATNAFQPFVILGDDVVATLNSLTRFFQNHRSEVLNRSKRFQIRSGFIFEFKVRAALETAGYTLTDVCRVERAEFDVVTLKGDTIWNFQCKNSLLDLTLIDTDPKRYARRNRTLERYYERALRKEARREALLLSRLGQSRIEHRVISRFPVATTNPAILIWSEFEAELAGGL